MKHTPPTIEEACAQTYCDYDHTQWEAVEWVEKDKRPSRWNKWHTDQEDYKITSEWQVGPWMVLVGFNWH